MKKRKKRVICRVKKGKRRENLSNKKKIGWKMREKDEKRGKREKSGEPKEKEGKAGRKKT